MKHILIVAAMLALAGAALAAPFTDQIVVTNVAVAAPVGRWTNAVVYAPAVSPKQGTQLVWSLSSGAVGYAVYYGDVLLNQTNKFDAAYNTSAVFFGLSSNTTYFFYTTAYDAARAESPPSALVIFKPGS